MAVYEILYERRATHSAYATVTCDTDPSSLDLVMRVRMMFIRSLYQRLPLHVPVPALHVLNFPSRSRRPAVSRTRHHQRSLQFPPTQIRTGSFVFSSPASIVRCSAGYASARTTRRAHRLLFVCTRSLVISHSLPLQQLTTLPPAPTTGRPTSVSSSGSASLLCCPRGLYYS